jgi:hypothetical protein
VSRRAEAVRSSRQIRSVALLLTLLGTGCTQVLRYSEEVTDERFGRSRFTRVPATVAATVGFIVGVPIDVAAVPISWAVYRGQARETRDPLSVFLFPSFVLWKVAALAGAPFDLVEWAAWRGWRPPPAITQQERDAIERTWDAREYFSEYPVTPLYPESPPQ